MKRTSKLIAPTEAEDARINAGIAEDGDNPELTADDFAQMQAASVVVPDVVRNPPVRGKQKAPTKVPVSVRLDPVVLERLKASGPGWQGRMNDILREAVGVE